MSGWVKHEFKSTTAPKRIPPSSATNKTWTVIDTFTAAELELGPTHLSMELAGILPSVRPKDIKTEFAKAGGTDPSKRHAHEIGAESGWASAPGGFLEWIEEADLPIELRLWHNAGSDLLLTKVITKAHNPLAELRGRL